MAAPPVPGLRFQPSDEEIVRVYLIPKILGRLNPYDVVTTEDVYSTSPEQLPLGNDAGHFIDNEWYFYTTRPISSHYRTRNGFYFATSMNEPILHNNNVVGFRRFLRFYLGSRPETGIETEWTVHEFRANPAVFPAANLLGSVVQEKLSSMVMCKIVRIQELSDNSSEEGVKDESGSSRINLLQNTRLNLQSSL
ncbi:PREDICTED: NAC domain-containing protein 67-like [Fragaria vesca subsp. vesca]|uniref:NAC domain-containing protein 67-like n=1 Tax=Fragaria vesca subsp. vesca TaxID=101020 RepID=UPI0002C3213B|nr:PREDICTED: NAC domain-containing protein 67-like [Fragaria vesca subsp. vesca]